MDLCLLCCCWPFFFCVFNVHVLLSDWLRLNSIFPPFLCCLEIWYEISVISLPCLNPKRCRLSEHADSLHIQHFIITQLLLCNIFFLIFFHHKCWNYYHFCSWCLLKLKICFCYFMCSLLFLLPFYMIGYLIRFSVRNLVTPISEDKLHLWEKTQLWSWGTILIFGRICESTVFWSNLCCCLISYFSFSVSQISPSWCQGLHSFFLK